MEQTLHISGSIPVVTGGVILFSRPESVAVQGQKSSQASVRGIGSDRSIKSAGVGDQPDALQFPAAETNVSSATPRKRTGKSMSRRSGQAGHVEKSGRWYVVRFWQDVPGQHKRSHRRERICPVEGVGSLGKAARERKAKEIVQASGADTLEHFEKVVMSQSGITFREQSKVWFTHMSNRKNKPVKPSTLLSWDGIVSLINESLGDLPLAALMEDQSPVVEFIAEQHDEGKTPKTIRNYMQVLKAVVSNAKDPKSRRRLFPVPWDNEYLDIPAVGKQNTHASLASKSARLSNVLRVNTG